MNVNVTKSCRVLSLATGASLLAVSVATAGEVTVWAWDPNFNGAAMELAGERYKANHPDFDLKFEGFAREEVEQKLQTQLAAGTTEGLPDIVLIEDYSAQKFLLSFPGAFEPLNGAIDYSGFADYKVKLATVGEETYSMPFDSGVTGWFYRSDILSEAGYSASDLENITWDRFIEIAKDVAAKTGKPMLSLDLNDPGMVVIMLQSTGSWFFNDDGSLNLVDNDAFRAVMETYGKILQTQEIYKPVNGWAEYTGAFTSGDVASTITGVWITGTIKAADMPGQWAVAPTPRIDGVDGAVNASNLGGSSWYVLSSSDNKDETKDFLNEVWGNDVEFYQEILVGQGAVGSLLKVREGEAYQSTDDYYGGQPVWQMFSQWLGEIPGVDYGIFTYEVRSAIATQLPEIAAGGDIDEAIEKIAAEAAVLTQ
jgi:lactose/L-arabinose transport system substrate-binding protein